MSKPGYRELCLTEHGEQCIRCGSATGIVAHHINGDRSDNRIENLAPLCGNCHAVWHRRDSWDDFDEFVRSREAGVVPDYLNEVDVELLNVMSVGRVTPTFAADEIGVSREYASERLKRLLEHDHVQKLSRGLYEITDDGRGELTDD